MGKVMLEVNNLKTKYVTRFHEDVYAVDGVSLNETRRCPEKYSGQ